MLDTFKYHPMKLFFISLHEVGCAVKKIKKKKKAKNYSLCLNDKKMDQKVFWEMRVQDGLLRSSGLTEGQSLCSYIQPNA